MASAPSPNTWVCCTYNCGRLDLSLVCRQRGLWLDHIIGGECWGFGRLVVIINLATAVVTLLLLAVDKPLLRCKVG